jgi:uncharacterized protein YbjT (DUF2867 family)
LRAQADWLSARRETRDARPRRPYRRTQRADVHFDWNDATTHRPALQEIDRLYLVAPFMRMDFADQVATFLDLAEAAGVRHVTYLSAYGIEQALL